MATIKETVKQALTKLPNRVTLSMIAIEINQQPIEYPGSMQYDQIKRALRDIKYVRRLADGRYVVKGRKVPARSTVECSACGTYSQKLVNSLCMRCQLDAPSDAFTSQMVQAVQKNLEDWSTNFKVEALEMAA